MHDLAQFFQSQQDAMPHAEHLPSYKKLQMVILAGVEQGLWKEGQLLPPERKLAVACGMSVGTVKRAMLELVHEGRLYRRQGSGTYVSGPSFTRQHRRHYLLLEDFGGRESPNAVQLHSVRRVSGPQAINGALSLQANEELFEIVRIFHEDNEKCVLAYSYLPTARFAGLDMVCRERLEHVPLYIVLEEDYRTPIIKTDELIGAIAAQSNESTLLDVAEGTPMLQIKSIVYTTGNKPFEYRISYCITKNKRIFRTIE